MTYEGKISKGINGVQENRVNNKIIINCIDNGINYWLWKYSLCFIKSETENIALTTCETEEADLDGC